MSQTISYDNYIAHYQADAQLSDYFEEDAFEVQNNRRRYEAFKALFTFRPGLRVLEVGSGGGPGARALAQSGVTYFPLDIPLVNLQRLKQQAPMPLHPLCGDVFFLPVQTHALDVVIISEVLEHLETPVPALQEIRRALKPGGTLLISVPYKERISYQVCVHCNQLTPFNAHFHSFDEQKLSAFLKAVGLRPKRFVAQNNKIADRLHLNIILRFLSYRAWRLIDRLINRILPKASHLIAICEN